MKKNVYDLAADDLKTIFDPTNKKPIIFPNPHPEAQCFPTAGLGLFMHFGIHSVKGIQPSWAMIEGFPWTDPEEYTPPEEYFKLARQFNPIHFNPDQILKAASDAGIRYAVITTKHHDGYALWPSQFGSFNTGTYMGGRDLLQPFVDACRKYQIKIGFYFSPRDWHYPNFPLEDIDFCYYKRNPNVQIQDPVKNQTEFKAFMQYTLGQLREILTRYGKIDLLWFDGLSWPGITDYRLPQVYNWIRSFQPGIVINDRWQTIINPGQIEEFCTTPNLFGDFATLECVEPTNPNKQWMELCNCAGTEHWGCGRHPDLKPFQWILDNYHKCQKSGCNYLCNISPLGDGSMIPKFYEYCKKLKNITNK